MGNGMESRLNFSDEFKQSLSQNAMTEEMAKKFLMSNGISEEKVNAHLSSIKYTIEAQKTRKREETLDALLTLYSYISEKGYVAYDTSFLAKTEQKNEQTSVPVPQESVKNKPKSPEPQIVNTETNETYDGNSSKKDEKIPEKVVNPNASSKAEPEQEVTTVERVNQTYDGTLPSERQKALREYFANRGAETIIVQGKERKISDFLQGNALKDGKIGAATIALEEKMKSEQSAKKSPETPVQEKNIDAKPTTEVQDKKADIKSEIKDDGTTIVIEESLAETYDGWDSNNDSQKTQKTSSNPNSISNKIPITIPGGYVGAADKPVPGILETSFPDYWQLNYFWTIKSKNSSPNTWVSTAGYIQSANTPKANTPSAPNISNSNYQFYQDGQLTQIAIWQNAVNQNKWNVQNATGHAANQNYSGN